MPAPTSVERSGNSSVRQHESVFGPVMSSLGWPIMIGLVAYWGFLLTLSKGWIKSDLLVRYLSAHPVSHVATAMFFVGLAALTLKLLNVCYQIWDKPSVTLSPASSLAQRPEVSRHLLDELDQLSPGRQKSYLGLRLRNALEFVDKTESANGLEDELKYLADMDAERQQESFALTRILIWAIPMLGFLGTVIGISGALGGLSVESDFNTMLNGLKEKLYVAFDTTALALTLSIVLMFAQFIVNRVETQLLSSVDESATDQLSGRFVTFGSNRDPYLASVEAMSQRVLDSIVEISKQQAEVWNQGLSSIQETTDTTLGRFAEILADRLSKQLDPVMDEFGIALRAAINDSTSYLERHGNKLAEAMNGSMEVTDQRNREIMATMQKNAEAIQGTVVAHAEGLKQCLTGSEDILQEHLQQVRQVMKKTVMLMSEQSNQLANGIENSHELMRANSDAIKQAIGSANNLMQTHTTHLNGVVQSSSLVIEEHARKMEEAITRSEEMVQKRQQTISTTQESMLKAQTQQSMAISSFTEKLETLQSVIDKSQAIESLHHTLNETLESLERSDTIAQEIQGLSRVVSEQVKSMDQLHLTQVQANEKQLAALIEQTQQTFRQNADLVGEYHRKIDDLISSLVHADNDSVSVASPEWMEKNLHALTMQLVNQNQTLAALGDKLESSFNVESLRQSFEQIASQLSTDHDQSELTTHLESIVEKLNALQQAFQQPSAHQEKFLDQQQQTITNQNQLLDFCQTLEVNNRSTFLDTANQILDSHQKSASKTEKMEESVRQLTALLTQLNQNITEQIGRAAESAFQFGKPDTPKRVA